MAHIPQARPRTAAPPTFKGWNLDQAIKKDAPLKASQIKIGKLSFIEKDAPKSFQEVERNLWKNNIQFTPRKTVDVLDISKEDFRTHTINSIDGRQENPSTFNVFRDSLKKTSASLHEKLLGSLPDMNLDEVTSNTSNSDSEHENEVVPLDFRTALVKQEGKIVIQAKPLYFKTVDEDLRDIEEAEERIKNGEDEYLAAVKKEAFAEDDDQVLMIDPGMDADTIFGDVKLPCEQVRRINNTLNAKVLPNEPKQTKRPVAQHYATVVDSSKTLAQVEKSFKYPEQMQPGDEQAPRRKTDNDEPVDNTPAHEVFKDDLKFDNILGSMGAGSLAAALDDLDLDAELYGDEEEEESKQ